MAVYAAESLLLAFALKLRVSAALAGHTGPRPAAPAAAAALGLDDGSFHRAASFLGQCMPTYVQQPGVGRPALKVGDLHGRTAGAGGPGRRTCCCSRRPPRRRCAAGPGGSGDAAAVSRGTGVGAHVLQHRHPAVLRPVPGAQLGGEARGTGRRGTARAWRGCRRQLPARPPCRCLLLHLLASPSPRQITGGAPAAILLLAPLLLLLSQDPLLLRALDERRRYAPPLAAVTLYLLAAGAWQLYDDSAGVGWGTETLAYVAAQSALLAATLPCQVYLLLWLWRRTQVRAGGQCAWVGWEGALGLPPPPALKSPR